MTSTPVRCVSGLLSLVLLLGTLVPGTAGAQQVEYDRPVDTAPTEQDIGEGYQVPPVQRPLPRPDWRDVADLALLAGAMGAAAWLVLRRRSRRWVLALTVACVAWFGFYREGCVCPVGSTQNVAAGLVDATYTVPLVVLFLFFLPLVLALFFGRVFCSGVCPLGAIQELVLLRPLTVPRRLDRALGLLKYAYLGLALWFATRPVVDRDFLICRFDPFVGFFRMTGAGHILMIGGGLLVLGLVIGRPYCRWLCPYGALLSLLSRFAWRPVSITPDKELDCGLCVQACPYGAIEKMRAVPSSCLACARCFRSCPQERVRTEGPPALPVEP